MLVRRLILTFAALLVFLWFREASFAGRYKSTDYYGGGDDVDYNYDFSDDSSRLREDPYSRSHRSNRRASLHGSSSRGSRGSTRRVSLN